MDFGKAFVFMFEDPNWVRKVGIGLLVALVGLMLSPILVGILFFVFIVGYGLDVTRNVVRGEQFPLPEWNDWGRFFIRGLKIAGALFIWSLPLLLTIVPIGFGGAWLDNTSGDAAGAGGFLLLMCGLCLGTLWGFFVALITPGITVRLATTDRFGSAFEVSELWNFTSRNLGNIIIVILLTIVIGLIAAIVGTAGVLLCFVGLALTIPLATIWQYLATAHLYGQVGAADRTARLALEGALPATEAPTLPQSPADEAEA
jgi:hypothetical protein